MRVIIRVLPLGRGEIAREGRDLTIVAWSKMVSIALRAADALSVRGIEAEVINLHTLWPWDIDLVLASAEKTGRLLVPQESVQVAGFANEIAMTVAERLGGKLKAPPARIGAPRIPVGYAQTLENEYRVTEVDVEERALALSVNALALPPAKGNV